MKKGPEGKSFSWSCMHIERITSEHTLKHRKQSKLEVSLYRDFTRSWLSSDDTNSPQLLNDMRSLHHLSFRPSTNADSSRKHQ